MTTTLCPGKKVSIWIGIIRVLLVLLPLISISQESQRTIEQLKGQWAGTLINLRIVFHLEAENDSIIVSMDSPDQGATGIPVNAYSFDPPDITFSLDAIGGKYIGTYDETNDKIEGTWFQSGMEFPLILERDAGDYSIKRPQEPKPPFPYLSEEVQFYNAADDVTLAGTLTIPEGEGPFPAAILITGSGPQNRDEEIAGHKPFLVLSDYLTRNGIAVLRYDDRGFGKSTGDAINATSEDFAQDAVAALEFLLQNKRIDPAMTGIIGHSEGAMIAPYIAAQDHRMAFIVMLAGPGLSGYETLQLQTEKILAEMGESREYINDVLDLNKKILDVIIKTEDKAKAHKKIRKAYDKFLAPMPEAEKAMKGYSDQLIEANIKSLLQPWMKYFLRFDIKVFINQVTCPMLLMYGEKDLQVPPLQNVPPLVRTLDNAGRSDYEIVILPDLNHLFQHAGTGAPDEYATIEETFAPEALEVILNFIKENGE